MTVLRPIRFVSRRLRRVGIFAFFAPFFLLAAGTLFGGEPREIGLIVDQPPGAVFQIESGLTAEIAERIDSAADDFSITLLAPGEKGSFFAKNGEAVPLTRFEKLWIFQGDGFLETTPLFAEENLAALRDWLGGGENRGVLLFGGAVALFDRLGYGPLEKKLMTFGNDREESGTIPIQPASKIFDGCAIDRETVWMTNAVYPAYIQLKSGSSDAVALSRPTTGSSSAILAGLGAKKEGSDARTAKVLAFSWAPNPLYPLAAEGFRRNVETLLTNLLRQSGEPLTPFDWTAPPFALPDFAALRRALEALAQEGDDYPNGEKYLAELAALEERAKQLTDPAAAKALGDEFVALQKIALLENPAIDFDEILFIRRDKNNLGFPENYNSNSSLKKNGYQNEIFRLNLRSGETASVYRPENDEFVGDIDLDFDAEKFLFSMPDKGSNNAWRVWELPLAAMDKDGGDAPRPKLAAQIPDADVDNYDACYLPDGRMIFCSTACFTGVPCIDGSGHVCNLYLRDADGTIRQLTIEQDHDWCPAVMNNGRVMYLRWEYTDLPHCYSRIMFHMNPDGTNQSELYGSGSYWPEAMFYARPIPNHPTKFAAIVTGHHEQKRVGDLVLFDPGVARREADGAVQRIPGFGKKVEPEILDLPIGQTWPKFTHPYPLSEELFLVACKKNPSAPWALCLADIYDNIVTLREEPEFALLEPVPIVKRDRPPSIPDRINKKASTADVFIADIYSGRGLKGVERGTVKSIRVISYQFAFQGMGAEPWSVGLDGPWDPKRILGTVPVNEDGSASFQIPAMTPISLQPLDAEGKAIQLMRSWITAMPGESVSCIGCHEEQNETGAASPRSIASRSNPVPITPFETPARGFAFDREIQPILDRYCLECHQPESAKTAEILKKRGLDQTSENAPFVPDFRTGERKPLQENTFSINTGALFSPSYYQLRRFVRTPTKESQMPTHKPFEFHADSTRLIQLLQNGHYDVALDSASWDRLIAWIDLNAPYHGNWGDIRNAGIPDAVRHQFTRRRDLRALYAGAASQLDDDPAAEQSVSPAEGEPDALRNRRYADQPTPLSLSAENAEPKRETVPLADGVSLELVRLPGTELFLSATEITNEMYRLFDSQHDSGIEYGDFINFSPGELGYALNRERQPAARVSWDEANAFCRWLSEKTGQTFTLPTAEEWEYAAKAGKESFPAFPNGDYAKSENLGDLTYAKINAFSWLNRPDVLPMWRPADTKIDDRTRVSALAASYAPNDWGIYDLLGNVAEWSATESAAPDGTLKKVVVGGSWATPLEWIGERRRFAPQLNVYDVGFRVIRRNGDSQ